MRTIYVFLLLLFLLTGCAGSYFSTIQDVHTAVQQENYQEAEALITEKKELQHPRNRVVYFLEKGIIAHLNGQYEESNHLLELAVSRMEEFYATTDIAGNAAEWLLSGKGQPYKGEDFERVMVHYYMALNYLMLHDLEDALVECRRVNTLLQELNERYEHKNVYKIDAFILYLSGIIYEAMGETNDAHIDYRHAYETYLGDYTSYYGTPVPEQLKAHLLRTSSALGFFDRLERYQEEFHQAAWPAQQEFQQAARLVVIWNNSVVPYKVEQTFREYIELDDEGDDKAGCYMKFSFPTLVPWIQAFSRADVSVGGKTVPLEFVEDLALIAVKNLEDRRIRTIAAAITRNVIKCAAEYKLEKENRLLGFLFGFLTEVTEGADTRQWSLLPANIHLTQVLLPPGTSDVELTLSGPSGYPVSRVKYENVVLKQGQTTFLIHRTF